jgi:hypothetical protein
MIVTEHGIILSQPPDSIFFYLDSQKTAIYNSVCLLRNFLPKDMVLYFVLLEGNEK